MVVAGACSVNLRSWGAVRELSWYELEADLDNSWPRTPDHLRGRAAVNGDFPLAGSSFDLRSTGSAVWRRGLKAVKEIQRQEPKEGEAVI